MLLVEQIKAELAKWLETEPLVEEIIGTMQEQEAEVSLESAQAVWLDFLETELGRGLSNSVAALVDGGKIKSEPLPF